MEHLPPVLQSGPLAPPTMSAGARLFNVFAAPGEVFDQIKGRTVSASNWLAPALMLIAVSWLGAWLVFSQASIQQQLREITDQAIEKQIAKNHMSEQQADQARAMATKFGSIGAKVSAAVAPVFAGLVTPFWWGLILWLVGTKAMGSEFSYMKAVEIAGLSLMIGVLDSVLRPLLILVMGNVFASASLAVFVKQFDPQNPMHGLLAMVNVMTFWTLLIRALGLARLSGVAFGKAAAWVFGIWFVLSSCITGFGFAMQALFNR
jgi:hypothetical protein